MELVKIKVKGTTNKFNEKRPNSLIFIETCSDDIDSAYLWMKDSSYARLDAELYFFEVEFLEVITLPL